MLTRFRAWLKRREDEMTAERAPEEGEEAARLMARVQIDTVFLWPTGTAMLPFWVWLTHGGRILALIGTALFGALFVWFTFVAFRDVVRMHRARRAFRRRGTDQGRPDSPTSNDGDRERDGTP